MICLKAKVENGYRNKYYRDFIPNISKKMMQAKADAPGATLTAWYFMRSRIPSGEEPTCDYLAVEAFEGFPAPLLSRSEALKKAGIDMTRDEYIDRRNSLVKLVDIKLYSAVEIVGETEPGNFVVLNYMKVRDFDEWLDLESNVWKQIQEARVKGGGLKAWGSHRLFLPRGTSLPYNAVTADVFPDFASVGRPAQMEKIIEKAHPGRRFRDIMTRTRKAREIVRADLYEVMEKVTPSGP